MEELPKKLIKEIENVSKTIKEYQEYEDFWLQKITSPQKKKEFKLIQ